MGMKWLIECLRRNDDIILPSDNWDLVQACFHSFINEDYCLALPESMDLSIPKLREFRNSLKRSHKTDEVGPSLVALSQDDSNVILGNKDEADDTEVVAADQM